MDSIITDTHLIQTFLVPAESVLIQMSDNAVRMDSVGMDFIYYRPVFRSQHYWNAEYNRLIEIMTMASVLV